MNLTLDRRFKARLRGRYERFEFKAGVLRDSRYKLPRPKSQGFRRLAGGPVRKKKVQSSGKVSEVAQRIRRSLKVPYLTRPFERLRSQTMVTFRRELGRLLSRTESNPSKAEAALAEVIREPLRKRRYGSNKASTARQKGFNRYLFDTGQFYTSLRAKVRVRRV